MYDSKDVFFQKQHQAKGGKTFLFEDSFFSTFWVKDRVLFL